MAIDFQVHSLRIRQVLPTQPDPAAAPTSVATFGDPLYRATYQAAVNPVTLKVSSGQVVQVGSIVAQIGHANSSKYATQMSLDLIVSIDGKKSVHFLTLAIAHSDPSGINPAKDVVTLLEHNQENQSGGNVIKFAGLKLGAAALAGTVTLNAPTTQVAGIWISVERGLLGDKDCTDTGTLVSLEKCDCEPICKISVTDLIADCSVKPPAEPIRGCQDTPVVAPATMMATMIARAIPGPQGRPGDPGVGTPGPPGADGEDGCTPVILYSRQVVYLEYCTAPIPADIRITPFGECHYWIHIIEYICLYAHNGDYCCEEFIWCEDSWVRKSDPASSSATQTAFQWLDDGDDSVTTPAPNYPNFHPPRPHNPCPKIAPPDAETIPGRFPGETIRICECIKREPCEPEGTLWTLRLNRNEPSMAGQGVGVAIVTGNDYFYYAKCAVTQPEPIDGFAWENATAECVADSYGELAEFVRSADDPVCCTPTEPCGGGDCDPEDTLWVKIALIGSVPEATLVGLSTLDETQGYYAVCSTTEPAGDGWLNMTPECYAIALSDTFIRTEPNPLCCSAPPDCPHWTTTTTTTAAPTTQPVATTTIG